MANLLEMSEATALGIHAMVLVAKGDGWISADHLAQSLRASKAHLSKVLSSLADAGLLSAKRGPGGGYALAQPADVVSLLQVYEVLQGPARRDGCLFDAPICHQVQCVLGDLVSRVRGEVFDHLATTTLRQAATPRREDVLLPM